MFKERGGGVYSETNWPWVRWSSNQSLELLVYGSFTQLPIVGIVDGYTSIFDWWTIKWNVTMLLWKSFIYIIVTVPFDRQTLKSLFPRCSPGRIQTKQQHNNCICCSSDGLYIIWDLVLYCLFCAPSPLFNKLCIIWIAWRELYTFIEPIKRRSIFSYLCSVNVLQTFLLILKAYYMYYC